MNQGVLRPTPTASSLATYSNIPVSLQTGVPDISYPLISVPTNSKMVDINLGLNYHTGNTYDESWASNVGKGWSLLGPGVISREIINDFDETFDDAGFDKYVKNEFNDIYNFSIPGESGKFRFIRDKVTNSFQLTKLTNFTSKIKYDSVANPATLIIDSFTIISESGIHYKFQVYDIATMNIWIWNHPLLGRVSADKKYRSAFYLSSITDENDQELVKYTYVRDLKYPPAMNQVPESETNKLTRIEIKDHGIIDINTTKDDGYSPKNDNFRINDIVLKTFDNRFVRKYTFQYSYQLPLFSRTLDSFTQVDGTGNTIEKYGFYYGGISFGSDADGVISSAVLKKIQLPTGGTVEYDFDLIPYAYREEIVHHPAPTEPYGNVSFDAVSTGAKKYFFTLDKVSDITIDASKISNLPQHTWALQFYKKTGNTFQMSNAIGPALDADAGYPTEQIRTFDPGEYYVELFTNDFIFPLKRTVYFDAFIRIGDPYDESVMKFSQGLARVKKVKYFNVDPANTFSAIPSSIEEYEYNKFDDPTVSSGYFVGGGSLNGLDPANPVIIYKNVKVSKGGANGYSKYYFKAPDAYPYPVSQNDIWPHFNLTRNGLMEKKEVYNNVNQKLTEDNFDYTFEEYDGPKYLVVPSYVIYNFHLKTSWIKSERVTSKNFFASGFAETKKEVTRNNINYKTQLEKVTSFDGRIQETAYQYALDKNNQKLIEANIIGIPLETTSIIKKNASDVGKLMSRAETKYDNPANKLPSSAVSYDTQNNLAEEVTFNRYDSKGNLEQYTTKEGIPVSVVWGYSKTQPIAKIEGATYDQISTYIADIVSKSDADIDVSSEQSFQSALDLFRNNSNLGNYQINTYVYDPLIGMKSMTPPSGIREMYQYDKAGRLDQIVDEKGKVLKKYKYNYKQ
ncbi:hypothetical protein ASG22_20490 [Chryseobacterium sp. Leaf405]|nr:hypothetical protein ASG22_20490 [Chryseobacterium sp. Leaf405]